MNIDSNVLGETNDNMMSLVQDLFTALHAENNRINSGDNDKL